MDPFLNSWLQLVKDAKPKSSRQPIVFEDVIEKKVKTIDTLWLMNLCMICFYILKLNNKLFMGSREKSSQTAGIKKQANKTLTQTSATPFDSFLYLSK